MSWDLGDRIPIGWEVRDPDTGELVAGATVTAAVTKPDGTTLSPAPVMTEASTGIWHGSFVADAREKWRWKFTVSGSITQVGYGSVDVGDPAVDTYVTLPTLREAANIAEGDRDALLQVSLSAAARAVDAHTGRPPGAFALAPTATARRFSVHTLAAWDGQRSRYRLRLDEFGSTTSLAIRTGDGTTWTTKTDYRTEPENALAYGQPISRLSTLTDWGCDLVEVTALWGWPATPDQVVEATLITALRFYRRKGTRSGVSDDGQIVRLVDPDVQQLLKPFTPVLVA